MFLLHLGTDPRKYLTEHLSFVRTLNAARIYRGFLYLGALEGNTMRDSLCCMPKLTALDFDDGSGNMTDENYCNLLDSLPHLEHIYRFLVKEPIGWLCKRTSMQTLGLSEATNIQLAVLPSLHSLTDLRLVRTQITCQTLESILASNNGLRALELSSNHKLRENALSSIVKYSDSLTYLRLSEQHRFGSSGVRHLFQGLKSKQLKTMLLSYLGGEKEPLDEVPFTDFPSSVESLRLSLPQMSEETFNAAMVNIGCNCTSLTRIYMDRCPLNGRYAPVFMLLCLMSFC